MSSKDPTRRTFLGWWLGTLMTAAVVTVVAPLGVYLFPPRDPRQMKQRIRVALDTPLNALREGAVTRFDAPVPEHRNEQSGRNQGESSGLMSRRSRCRRLWKGRHF